jgi:hypothetical protein
LIGATELGLPREVLRDCRRHARRCEHSGYK